MICLLTNGYDVVDYNAHLGLTRDGYNPVLNGKIQQLTTHIPTEPATGNRDI